jgi:uncharacterized protein (TIRG00374 family)
VEEVVDRLPPQVPLSDEGVEGVADPLVPKRPTALRRALRFLLPAIGFLLLAVLLWKVPWKDRIFLSDGRVLHAMVTEPGDGSLVLADPTEDGAPARVMPNELLVRPDDLPAVEEGIFSLARRVQPWPALLAVALNGVMLLVSILRWKVLLDAQGIHLPLRENINLSLMGGFFNQVVPGGLVGGDVVKAVYASKGRERAAPAVVSIFVDRVAGLLGTVMLAGVALIPRLDDPRYLGPALLCYGIIAAQVVLMAVVFSRRLRRLFRLEKGLGRVPVVGAFLAESDRAVQLYRGRTGVVVLVLVMSVAIHIGVCGINALLGNLLGIDLPATAYFAIIPAILVVSAIPLLPGGWGIGEASYVFFLGAAGVPPAQALALSILWRSIHLFWAMPGGVLFLMRRM